MSQHPIGYLTRFKSQVEDAERLFPGEPHEYLWSYTHGTTDMEHFAAFPDIEVVPVCAVEPTLDAAVAAARAEERAAWQPAIALAQQCIEAAYEDRWPEFDRLSDEFDDACADAVLRLKPDAAAIRDLKPEGE